MTEAFKSFVSGGCGGMSLVFVGHPLDTIKVRLQTAEQGVYRGLMDCALKTIRSEGIGGLYSGIAAPLVGITPIFAVYFLGYDWGKSIAASYEGVSKDKISTAGVIFAGGFSAFPGTVLMVPGERVKVILQTQGNSSAPPKYNGTLDCFKTLAREEGILRGWYKGTGLTLLRDIPGSMAYYGAYEIFKRVLTPADGKMSTLGILTAGGLAGVCNWLVAVPPDTLKSRFQTAEAGRYPGGVKQVFSELVKQEGITGMYRGLGPAMVRAIPANAACFLGMEVSRKLLDKIM